MNSRVLLMALATLLFATTTAQAGWWPWGGSKYRSVAEMEQYRFDHHAKRLDRVKELKRQAAEEAARVPEPEPEPKITIEPERVAAPYLEPYVVAVARYPTSTEASRRLIREYARLKRYDLALAEFDRIFKYNPSWKQGFLLRADLYEEMEQLEKARAEYDLLIVDEPNWIKPRFRRAQLLERLALDMKALEDWETLAHLAQSQGLDEINAAAGRHIQELRNR